MNRFYPLLTMVAILLTTIYLPLTPVKASGIAQTTCTQAMLKGSYQFLAPATITVASGTVIAVPEELLGRSPAVYASKGTLAFDGAGNLVLTALEQGQHALASPILYTGSYTMNTDCTATATVAHGIQVRLKVMEHGQEQTLHSLTPGFVIIRSTFPTIEAVAPS